MKAYTKELAWSLAFGLLDADVEHDDEATERAGYPLYTAKEGYAQVADLGGRLEVTDSKSNTVNIWIVDETTPKKASENLEAIQTVELSRGDFRTNTCLQIVSVEEAKVRVCEEFGFEVGALKIHGVPCFDAYDYNFIRFESKGWRWVVIDGEIYREYI